MASPAHCFYCFEVLSANFDRREPPSLERVLDLYDQYKTPASTDASTNGDDEDDNDDVGELGSDEEDPDPSAATISRPQIPSISRLQASTPSSSSSSTPSLLSANSSNSQLTAATSVSSQPSYSSRLSLTATYPLFVTWNTISRHNPSHKSLRGCIGTFDSLPLSTGLATYALTSALDDTRFSPIPAALIPSLSCSLTLLANFEPCENALDWTLGVHGLRLSFTHRGRRHGATYLPDVAVEQGWDKEATVESLMRKAGWESSGHGVARRLLRGASRSSDEAAGKPWEEVSDLRAVRYTGLKASASCSEWKEWRIWAESQKDGLSSIKK